jgi:hypothetical protein
VAIRASAHVEDDDGPARGPKFSNSKVDEESEELPTAPFFLSIP